ncbi:unnamed protein product, partial [Allacma fusca]
MEHRQKWLDWRKTVNFLQVCRESQIDPATKGFPITTKGWRPNPATSTATSGELDRVLAQENSSVQRNDNTAASAPDMPPSPGQTVEIATSDAFIQGRYQPNLSDTEDSNETGGDDEQNMSSISAHSANTDVADSHQLSLADFANSPQYE